MFFFLFRIRFLFVVAWTAAAFLTGFMMSASEKGCVPHTLPAAMPLMPYPPPPLGPSLPINRSPQ